MAGFFEKFKLSHVPGRNTGCRKQEDSTYENKKKKFILKVKISRSMK